MPVTIHDRTMTSDRTPHAARRLTRNEAITAMTLAEACGTTAPPERNRLWPHIRGWTGELGITADHAITRIAALPAWTATAGTEPGRPDPEAGA
jgi:hypothetical protein